MSILVGVLLVLADAAVVPLLGPRDPSPVFWRISVKSYRPWHPEQSFLMPPSPNDWLPEGHLVYFILDVVKALDLGEITRAVDARDARGEKPYSPVMMTALLLYAYCVGVYSSRRIERATYEDVAFRVISGGEHPHFTRIAAFRRRHLDAFAGIFVQSIEVCREAGMVSLGLVAIDGTKMQGNASKHKAMSYERMGEQEQRLRVEIESLLQRAEEADQSEDNRFGASQQEEDLPEELRRREGRLEKILAAKHALEQEALQVRADTLKERADVQERKAAQESDPTESKRAATRARKAREEAQALEKRRDDDDEPPSHTGDSTAGLPTHRIKATPEGKPHPKAQYNFTDPESRIQESGGVFLQGYNCQAVVDADSQVIVAQGVTNLAPDNGQLVPMLDQVSQTCGRAPQKGLGDAGYWAPDNPTACEQRDIDIYISTRRARHGNSPADPFDGDSPRATMEAKLSTSEARALYASRKAIVEPVFGQIKEVRGFRRFLLRGMRKVAGEWSMLTATHNLLKLFRNAPLAAQA